MGHMTLRKSPDLSWTMVCVSAGGDKSYSDPLPKAAAEQMK